MQPDERRVFLFVLDLANLNPALGGQFTEAVGNRRVLRGKPGLVKIIYLLPGHQDLLVHVTKGFHLAGLHLQLFPELV